MAGHSHWAGIKHKKERQDKKRGRVFSRCSKAIMGAVRRGGKDLALNLELQYALEEARACNMPKDTIERAILKGAGELAGHKVEAIRYEGYGAGGAAVIVDALSDNRNRSSAEIRHAFDNHGGNLGTTGCVSWNFETKGTFMIVPGDRDEAELFELVVEAGAEDFRPDGEYFEVICGVEQFHNVKTALDEEGIACETAEISEVPTGYTDLDENDGRKMLKLMEELDENEDVTNVYSNFNLPESLVAELAAEED